MYFSITLKSLSIVTFFFAFMTIIMVLIIIIINNVITDSYGVRNSFNIMDSYVIAGWRTPESVIFYYGLS